MKHLAERNQKIIDALIAKAKRVCPGSLALIGIYGSFMTGDTHEKSDLDLLVLINDDEGRKLTCTFIQDDLQVGHDIYCTTWENLEYDAAYHHPHISKLMDSQILYCADESYRKRLENLRNQVKEKLCKPLTQTDFAKAESMLREAEHYYTRAILSEALMDVRKQAGGVLYCAENALAMLNKTYFKCGVKRIYDELDSMKYRPENVSELIENIVSAVTAPQLKENLTAFIKEIITVFEQVKDTIPGGKQPVTAAGIAGTYEEMYSNWRNKMYLAAADGNRHLAFMSMINLDAMLSEIGGAMDIGQYDVLGGFRPDDLFATARAFDEVLREYLKEYEKAGVQVQRYADVDEFVKERFGS